MSNTKVVIIREKGIPKLMSRKETGVCTKTGSRRNKHKCVQKVAKEDVFQKVLKTLCEHVLNLWVNMCVNNW